jgi:hypothetical protein
MVAVEHLVQVAAHTYNCHLLAQLVACIAILCNTMCSIVASAAPQLGYLGAAVAASFATTYFILLTSKLGCWVWSDLSRDTCASAT